VRRKGKGEKNARIYIIISAPERARAVLESRNHFMLAWSFKNKFTNAIAMYLNRNDAVYVCVCVCVCVCVYNTFENAMRRSNLSLSLSLSLSTGPYIYFKVKSMYVCMPCFMT
jgi:hypothetical protein